MSQGFIKGIDEGVIGRLLNGALDMLDKGISAGISKAADHLGSGLGIGHVFGMVKETFMGSSIHAPEHGQQMAHARAPEITPVQQPKPHEVSMADLGHFSAPTFGGGALSAGGRQV